MEFFKSILDRTGVTARFGGAAADQAPSGSAAGDQVASAGTLDDKTAEGGTGGQSATPSVDGPLRAANWGVADEMASGLRQLQLCLEGMWPSREARPPDAEAVADTNKYKLKELGKSFEEEEQDGHGQESHVDYDGDKYETLPKWGGQASTIHMSQTQANRHKVAFEKKETDVAQSRGKKFKEKQSNVALSVQRGGVLGRMFGGRNPLTGENIFAMGPDGSIYATKGDIHPDRNNLRKDASGRTADMHHSSFLRGKPVAGAGEITTNKQGFVTDVSDQSGHYRPSDEQNHQVLERLQRVGVSLDNVKFHSTEGGSGMATEYQQGRTTEQFGRRHDLIDELKRDPRFMARKAAADSEKNPPPLAPVPEPAAPVAPAVGPTQAE